jgi:branched-chain amino acid transport system substrate-binding protein
MALLGHNANMLILRTCSIFIALFLLSSMPMRAEIHVGIPVPLSGPLQLLGEQARLGALSAINATNANGGIDGEEVRAIVADDRCSEDAIEQLATSLLTDGGSPPSAVLGLLCFEPALALRKQAGFSDVPFLSLATRLPDFTGSTNEAPNFRFAPGPQAESDAIVETILSRWDGLPFAIVDDGTVYGLRLAGDVRTKLELAGRSPQLTETYRPTQTSQSGLVRRLAREGVRAALIAGDGEDIAVIGRDIERLGADMEILAGEAALAPFLPGSELSPPSGLLAVGAVRPESMASTARIRTQFEAAGQRGEGYVLRAYAATQAVLQALANQRDGQSLAQTMKARRASTILGPASFNADGSLADQKFILYRFSDGAFSPMDTPG